MNYRKGGSAIAMLISIFVIGIFVFIFFNTVQGRNPLYGLPGAPKEQQEESYIDRAKERRDDLNARDEIYKGYLEP